MSDGHRCFWTGLLHTRWLLILFSALVGPSGCHRTSESPDGFGGESHFLRDCLEPSDCGDGLTCLAGLCTTACELQRASPDATCQALHPDATCLADGDAAPACDLACEDGSDCRAAALVCEAGRCREGGDVLDPGYVECSEAGCPTGTQIPWCPDGTPLAIDTATVASAAIEGDQVRVNVQYGGCRPHRFSLCQDRPWGEFPVSADLRLRHEPSDGTCDAVGTVELTFDLSLVAQRYADAYGDESGVIGTPFGFYTFGTPTCIEREATASQALGSGQEALPGRCDSAADCILVPLGTSCFSGCGPQLISTRDQAAWELLSETINEQICHADAEADKCMGTPQPCPANPFSPGCFDGQCGYGQF